MALTNQSQGLRFDDIERAIERCREHKCGGDFFDFSILFVFSCHQKKSSRPLVATATYLFALLGLVHFTNDLFLHFSCFILDELQALQHSGI